MADQLVNNVRLRRVLGRSVVSNVLGGVEHAECQSVKEFALGEQTSYRLEPPAGLSLQVLGN